MDIFTMPDGRKVEIDWYDIDSIKKVQHEDWKTINATLQTWIKHIQELQKPLPSLEDRRDALARKHALLAPDAVRGPKWPAGMPLKEWIAQGGDIQSQTQWEIYDTYVDGFNAALNLS